MQNQPQEYIISADALNQIFDIIGLQVPTLAGQKLQQQLNKARPYTAPEPPAPKQEKQN